MTHEHNILKWHELAEWTTCKNMKHSGSFSHAANHVSHNPSSIEQNTVSTFQKKRNSVLLSGKIATACLQLYICLQVYKIVLCSFLFLLQTLCSCLQVKKRSFLHMWKKITYVVHLEEHHQESMKWINHDFVEVKWNGSLLMEVIQMVFFYM